MLLTDKLAPNGAPQAATQRLGSTARVYRLKQASPLALLWCFLHHLQLLEAGAGQGWLLPLDDGILDEHLQRNTLGSRLLYGSIKQQATNRQCNS